MDVSPVFDTISHSILLVRVSDNYGVSGAPRDRWLQLVPHRLSPALCQQSSSAVTARRLFTARWAFHKAPSSAEFCSRLTYHPTVSSVPVTALNTTSVLTIRSCSWPCGHRLFVPVCRRSRPAPSTSDAGLPRTTFCSMPTSQRS